MGWRPVLIGVEKYNRRLDVWVEAAMDGAVLNDLLECRAMLVANAAGEVDFHRQFRDSPRGLGRHVFFDFDFEPV